MKSAWTSGMSFSLSKNMNIRLSRVMDAERYGIEGKLSPGVSLYFS